MDYPQFMEVVKNRRSVRTFKPDPVPEEMIGQVVEAAKLAPTGNNTQPLEIVAVTDRALISEIESKMGEAFIPAYVQRFKAPAMLVVLGDPRLCAAFPKGPGVPEKILHASLCLAIENMFLAIAALGLGSVWKDVPPLSAVQIKDLLKIPQIFDVTVVMPLGFPRKDDVEARPKREIPVHFNTYDETKFKSDEDIEQVINKYCRVRDLGKLRVV